MIDVNKIVAAINPDLYCVKDKRKKVKEIAKKEGYLAAAKEAEPLASEFMDLTTAQKGGAFAGGALKNPIEKHELLYEVQGGSLEPIYFWILDYLNANYKDTKKLVDTFQASPGSSQFAEMGSRATRMQEEGMKLLATANTLLKSILNIIYDLKEFKLRLEVYKDYHSENKERKLSALLSLKQIWMDSVDIKRGNSSVKAMAAQFDYVTLIDAFMAANSLDDVTKPADKGGLDLNERVRRILQQRVGEFFRWIEESEKELNKRFEIEKLYLKSQVNSIKLYARWAKPYLEAAKKLEQQASNINNGQIVNAFNTTILELALLGTKDYEVLQDIYRAELPEMMRDMIKDKKTRNSKFVILVSFRFIGIPERFSQQGGYGFKGRVELVMTSYALNEDEIKALEEAVEKDDFGDIYGAITGATDNSLAQVQADIDEFVGVDDSKEKKKEEAKKKEKDSNPITSLFSFSSPSKENEKSKVKLIKPDDQFEKAVRNQAVIKARDECRKFYDAFKGLYNMPRMKISGPGS